MPLVFLTFPQCRAGNYQKYFVGKYFIRLQSHSNPSRAVDPCARPRGAARSSSGDRRQDSGHLQPQQARALRRVQRRGPSSLQQGDASRQPCGSHRRRAPRQQRDARRQLCASLHCRHLPGVPVLIPLCSPIVCSAARSSAPRPNPPPCPATRPSPRMRGLAHCACTSSSRCSMSLVPCCTLVLHVLHHAVPASRAVLTFRCLQVAHRTINTKHRRTAGRCLTSLDIRSSV